MAQQLNTGNIIQSLTENSSNEWRITSEDNKMCIYFDYGVWSNGEKNRMALYSNGESVGSVEIEGISEESIDFLETNIII